jgi:hypothetical protein
MKPMKLSTGRVEKQFPVWGFQEGTGINRMSQYKVTVEGASEH